MEKRFLIERWLGSNSPAIPIYDEASVSSARQLVREAGDSIKASNQLVEGMALIASELTHNHLVHAKQGYFSVRPIERSPAIGLEIIAADIGPGLEKTLLSESVRTEGSLGAGLEGVFRLADEVEIDTRRAEGLCVAVRKFDVEVMGDFETAIAGEPFPGEIISGDDAICLRSDSGFVAAVSDGLGHGPEARDASRKCIEAIVRHRDMDLREMLLAVNAAISATRGCALSIVRFDKHHSTLQCLSTGDVRCQLYFVRDAHFFNSTPLIVGEGKLLPRRLRVEEAAVVPGSVFVMFTDGLETKTNLKGQLDILRRPPIVIAQHMLQKHSRRTDDSLIFVASFR